MKKINSMMLLIYGLAAIISDTYHNWAHSYKDVGESKDWYKQFTGGKGRVRRIKNKKIKKGFPKRK